MSSGIVFPNGSSESSTIQTEFPSSEMTAVLSYSGEGIHHSNSLVKNREIISGNLKMSV
jgi:hypothetical protein